MNKIGPIMGINKRGSNKLFVWLAAGILAILLIADVLFRYNIESCKRAQAVFNLGQAKTCMHSSIKEGTEVMYAIRRCTKSSRVTSTGDMYVLDYENLEFVYDPSRDVPRARNTYFTEDSIGAAFNVRGDWGTAANALVNITSGKDSDPSMRTWYNYDGSVEWLEWFNFYPTEVNGYVGPDAGYIVVQGAQSDEAVERFLWLRIFIGGSGFAVAFLLIILSTHKE